MKVIFTPENCLLDSANAVASGSSRLLPQAASPGYIVALRYGLGLTQAQLGERLGVDKMTVYRWESGTLRPGTASLRAIEKLRKQSVRRGIAIES